MRKRASAIFLLASCKDTRKGKLSLAIACISPCNCCRLADVSTMLLARLARSARPAAVRRFAADAPITQALPRTIPDDALDFEMRMYVHAGRKLPVPEAHMISEYKVKLRVKVADLGLDDLGEARLAYLTGPRFDAARGVLTLTAERFPSRTENRRYLIHQLELLKQAASEADDEFDAAWRRLKEGE